MNHPDGELDNVAPDTFPISPGLAESLDHWADEFDGILNEDDPASSDFATPDDERRFNDQGRNLAQRLAREMGPEYKVTYFDILDRKDVSINIEE
ncbi:hypothetical protein AB0L06_20025 [Spirillospora sp. NPDC052269]